MQASAWSRVRRRRGGPDRHGRLWGAAAGESRVAATDALRRDAGRRPLLALPGRSRRRLHRSTSPIWSCSSSTPSAGGAWARPRSSSRSSPWRCSSFGRPGASDCQYGRLRAAPGVGAPPLEDDLPHSAPAQGRALLALSLAALGVVYGDIGTSPLYAIKECFAAGYGVPPTPGERPRRPLARLLVAQLRRHREVPHLHHAGRQPRRGRDPRPPRAAAAPPGRAEDRGGS